MTVIGLVLLLLAGLAQSSFGLGMKKQLPLSWEAFWLIYSISGMFLIPLIWGISSFSGFFEVIFSSDPTVLSLSMLLGFLWGIGGILFGKSVNMVGISITNGVVMGLAGGLGAIIPMIGIACVTSQPSFKLVVIGICLMLIGVALSAYSGVMREREQNISSDKSDRRTLMIGLIVVVVSGILSSLLNVGFEAANPIARQATEAGASNASAALPARAVVVFGGLLMNAGYAVILLFKNKTWGDFKFSVHGSRKSFVWALLTGFLWFLPLGLAGIVSQEIGEMGNVISWPVMLSLSLVFGNIWGYMTGEWKNTKYSFILMFVAAFVLIVASLILTFKDNLIF